MEKFIRLTHSERRESYRLRRLGVSIRRIARHLSRSASTISREFKRNAPEINRNTDYIEQASVAQEVTKARRRAASKKMRLKNPEIQEFIEGAIRGGLTPELAAGRLSVEHPELPSISHEAVYQWVYEERRELIDFLPISGKKRRKRSSSKKYRFKAPATPKSSIEERFEGANDRSELGHWEGDLIIGSGGRSAVLSLIERRTRIRWHVKIENRTSDVTAAAIIGTLKTLPRELLKSLTLDNGTEFADWERVERELQIKVFFCHPYCAPERGQVEHCNRQARTVTPKGTNFDLVSEKRILDIGHSFNQRPMKVLKFLTPYEYLAKEMRALRAHAEVLAAAA